MSVKPSLINLPQFDTQMARAMRYEFNRQLSSGAGCARAAVEDLLIKIIKSLGCNEIATAYGETLGSGMRGEKPNRRRSTAGDTGRDFSVIKGFRGRSRNGRGPGGGKAMDILAE